MNRSRYDSVLALNNAAFRELVSITAVPFPLDEFCEAWALQRGLPHPSDCIGIVPVRPAPRALMPRTRKLTAVEIQMALTWRDEAMRYAGACCEVCGYDGPHLEVHHVISQSVIRREFRSLGLDVIPSLLWDLRDSLVLCDEPAPNRCHTRHTNAFQRVPRRKLRDAHFEFARELDGLLGDERFTVRLEQEYPA